MKRILIISDSPTMPTGFGQQALHLVRMLRERHTVACLAWGFTGWPGDPTAELLQPAVTLFPADRSVQPLEAAQQAIRDFRPDVVLVLAEAWMVPWLQALRMGAPPRPKLIFYCPISGHPYPIKWGGIFAEADALVVPSIYGSDELFERYRLDARVIPHAIAQDYTWPIAYGDVAPDSTTWVDQHILPQDGRFVIGCVARNQPRKMLPMLMDTVARLRRHLADDPTVKPVLYIHTDPQDEIGSDLLALRRELKAQAWCHFPQQDVWNQGFTPSQMVRLYSTFDLMVLPTQAEGFGVPIVEAMASGTPVLTTGFAAGGELVRESLRALDRCGHDVRYLGHNVVSPRAVIRTGWENVYQAIPDDGALLACLHGQIRRHASQRHCDPTPVQTLRQVLRDYGGRFCWTKLRPRWLELITTLTEGSP